MDPKKNKHFDLNRQRPLWLGVGLVSTLLLVLTAFEWKTEVEPVISDAGYVGCTFLPFTVEAKQSEYAPPPTFWDADGNVWTNDASYMAASGLDDTIVTRCGFPPLYATKHDTGPNHLHYYVDIMPEFPGGRQALIQRLKSSISYPKQAEKLGVEGRVFVKFVVEANGSISSVDTIKGIGAGCDKEAERVVKMLPDFEPGQQNGVPVRVQMIVPISFQLK